MLPTGEGMGYSRGGGTTFLATNVGLCAVGVGAFVDVVMIKYPGR
jgi:hypothetical protein